MIKQCIVRALWSTVIVILSYGCESDVELIGTGPITLTARQASSFEEWKSGAKGGPLYFFIRKGGSSLSVYCESSFGANCADATLRGWWNQCEARRSGCLLYGEIGQIVWRLDETPTAAVLESTLQAHRSSSVPPGFERYQSPAFAYDFRAFAIKSETGRWGRAYHVNSPKRAIDFAINHCERTGQECRLYALGDTIVEGMSPEQIAKVAQDYYVAVSPLMANADLTNLPGKRLSSEEILEHLSNSVVEAVTYNNLKYRGRWQTNGTMSATATHQIGIESATVDNGTWSVSDDKLCRQWQQWLGGRHECLVVTKDGSTLRAYDIHGDRIEIIELIGKIRGSQQES